MTDKRSLITNKIYIPKSHISSVDKPVISKEFSLGPNPKILRNTIEPLHINSEISESSSSEENDEVYLTAKTTRTGYLPFGNEFGSNKKQNQDAFAIITKFCGAKDAVFLGVFDGHGVNGGKVSNLIKRLIPDNISKFYSNENSKTFKKTSNCLINGN